MRLEQVQDMSLLHFLNDVLTTIKVLCLYSQMINTQQYICNKLGYFIDFQYLYMAKHKDENHVEIS